jgi:hypothetical protein
MSVAPRNARKWLRSRANDKDERAKRLERHAAELREEASGDRWMAKNSPQKEVEEYVAMHFDIRWAF